MYSVGRGPQKIRSSLEHFVIVCHLPKKYILSLFLAVMIGVYDQILTLLQYYQFLKPPSRQPAPSRPFGVQKIEDTQSLVNCVCAQK